METYSSLNKAGRGVASSPEHKCKGQLGERVFGVVAQTAKQMGKTVPELLALMQKGQVGANEFVEAFIKVGETVAASGGAFATASNSLQSKLNDLSTTWFEFVEEVNKQGGLDLLIMGIKSLTEALRAAQPYIEVFAKAIRVLWTILIGTVDFLWQFVQSIWPLGKFLLFATPLLILFNETLYMTLLRFVALAAPIAGIVGLLLLFSSIVAALKGEESIIGDMSLRNITDADGALEGFAILLSKVFMILGNIWAFLGHVIAAIATLDFGLIGIYFDELLVKLEEITGIDFNGLIDGFTNWITTIWDRFTNFFSFVSDGWDGLKKLLSGDISMENFKKVLNLTPVGLVAGVGKGIYSSITSEQSRQPVGTNSVLAPVQNYNTITITKDITPEMFEEKYQYVIEKPVENILQRNLANAGMMFPVQSAY